MLSYYSDRKRKDNAINQTKANYVKKRKEIITSDLDENEKQIKLEKLLSETKATIEIINDVKSIDEIPEEDRKFLGIEEKPNEIIVDENVINTLVEIFAEKAREKKDRPIFMLDEEQEIEEEEIDTTKFEEELRSFFTEHYSDLLDTGYNEFLSNFVKPKKDSRMDEETELLEDIAQRCNIDPKKLHYFGYMLTVQDGLVAEEENTLGKAKVYYATEKGLNNRIATIYNDILYSTVADGTNRSNKLNLQGIRGLKNAYITYAEQNNIEIQDKDVLESIPVDKEKVQGIARYINRKINSKDDIKKGDYTKLISDDITRNYSKIMNLAWYNFSNLESVMSIQGQSYDTDLSLTINDDSIIHKDDFNPDIAYGTTEYLTQQYQNVMERVKETHSTNAFLKSPYEVRKANREKQALRRYIKENDIKGIDISIPQVEINHDMTNLISNALVEQYGNQYENNEDFRNRILTKLEDNWSEIMTECQCVDINDLFKDELKEIVNASLIMDTLYVREDFVYLGDNSNYNARCIYATPESLKRNIDGLDNIIATRDFCFDEEKERKVLESYALSKGFDIEIPDVEDIKNIRRKEKEEFTYGGGMFSSFGREELPDDPTAREKIDLNDSFLNLIVKMSEGNPGAIVGLTDLLKADKTGGMLLLGLDDMNIRGSQVWVAYKDLYHENAEKFAQAVHNRDRKMVDFINQEQASVGEEKAVTGGASFDRSKTPDKYRFTEEEVEELRQQKEERLEKERKAREKMLANSPAKKNRGAKKRAEREEKRQAYRQRLIALGKKSIGELDEELTELQSKEEQAKELCEQYEEQLPDKSHQEL